jgi:hypothetical protein
MTRSRGCAPSDGLFSETGRLAARLLLKVAKSRPVRMGHSSKKFNRDGQDRQDEKAKIKDGI